MSAEGRMDKDYGDTLAMEEKAAEAEAAEEAAADANEDDECCAEFIDGSWTTWLCSCDDCRQAEWDNHAECAPGGCMTCDDEHYAREGY